jgi:hypothetical protein
MIQLASDPNASRMNWRPAQADDKGAPLQASTRRHAWPFISRQADKPAEAPPPRKAGSEHGS